MAESGPRRKLAAILAADVVGFSKMMGENEDRTLRNLKAGMESSPIQLESIGEMLARNKEKVNLMFLDIFTKTLDQQNCGCLDSIVNL